MASIDALFITSAEAAAIEPAVEYAAQPLPLTAVRLTGGPLKHAQDLNAEYLLALEPDRMLSHYRRLAGLEPKAPGYGGWDADGRQLTGHIGGHYLSAVSLMWAATGDERFRERAEYLVDQLKEVQDAHGNGFAGALENCQERFAEVSRGEIRSGGFDLNGLWAPWYTLHKTFAGLRDAYRYTGNEKALDVEVAFAAWAEGVLADLDDEQVQKMLDTEFGGMNEVLVDLYVDTGDKRWLDLSYKFEHKVITEPLKRGQDTLAGKHGNTQIPKLIGSLDRYVAIGDEGDGAAASYFWDRVADHHSFATGGNGKDEYFSLPDTASAMSDGRTAESCNVYNMLKLTRELFALAPDVKYARYMERALFNHVLGSIDPENGSTCYMVPVGQGVYREYSDMFNSFTCCVGSGMESHALHGDGVYYTAGDKLWVNFYTPSTASWEDVGAVVEVDTAFPEGDETTVKVQLDEPRELTLCLRRPEWAGEGVVVAVNGEPLEDPSAPGSYVEISRRWESGDKITLTLPKVLHAEPTPDNPSRVALMWGPLVLAGDLGAERRRGDGERENIPVFVADEQDVATWLKPDEDKSPVVFKSDGVGRERDLEFSPFYRLHRRSYGAYWDLYTQSQWEVRAAEIEAERERLRRLEEVTVAYVRPGNMQSERDFNYQGEESWPVRVADRAARYGRDWFSFDVPVEADAPIELVATYRGGQRRRDADFSISVDGEELATVSLKGDRPAEFFDEHYPIPAAVLDGKQTVTVRFEATERSSIGPIFGLRVIRGESPPE